MKKHICLILILLTSIQGFSQKKFQRSEYSKYLQNHPFGSISENYTLVLTGYFDDCGEFGGHEETIELLRIDRKLTAIVNIYDKSCQDTNYAEPKVIDSKTYLIEKSKVPFFQEYLTKLLAKSLEEYVPFHAGRTYSAKLEFKKSDKDNDGEIEDDYDFQRINLIFHDNASDWSEFQKLKNIVEK
tara:strand:- start:32 stop:586 length:555 start_codon:yes stop_codon:yes gene_type:complete